MTLPIVGQFGKPRPNERLPKQPRCQMKKLALILVLALLGCQAKPLPKAKPRNIVSNSSVEIIMEKDGGLGSCSATIVGSHALITAKHCAAVIDKDTAVKVGDFDIAVTEIINLKYDQAFILETGVFFPPEDIAPLDFNNFDVEDTLRGYGNPKELKHQFRKGVVMGFNVDDGVPVANLDMHVAPGDSGMGLFKNGKLVGVLSGYIGWENVTSLMPAYVERIDATPEQIKKATEYNGSK